MSELRVNTIVAAEGTSAPSLPYGFQVPTGMGITGAGGVNITGVVTATSFSGDGSSLSGIGETVNVRTETITVSGVSTFTGASNFSAAVNVDATTDSTSATSGALIVDGGLGVAKNVYIGAGLSVAGTLTYEDVTNVDSVGLITAKSGVNVTGGQLQVGAGFSVGAAGVGTFAGNITVGGEVAAATLDISGNADIDGTMEADAITVNGTALNTVIAGVTVTNATNATNSTHVYVTDNESTNESNLITFVEGATSSTGNVGLEMDGNLHYNPSSGTISATEFVGGGSGLTGISGVSLSGSTNNTVATVTGANALAGESNLTFDGSTLTVTGAQTVTDDFTLDNGASAGKDIAWDASAYSLKFSDGVYAKFGSDGDASLLHDGSNFYIENGTGEIRIRPKSSENAIVCVADGATSLYYDNSAKIATTNDGSVTTGIGTFTKGANFDGILSEKFQSTAGKLSSNTNIYLADGMVHYFTTTETTTCTPNIGYDGSKTLNNILTTGDCITVTVITTAAAAGYSANWNIDGSGITEEWVGGEAPTAGGANGHDIYTLNILKTANATYKVIINLVNAT